MYSYLLGNLKSQFVTSNARTQCRGIRRIQLIHQICHDLKSAQYIGIQHEAAVGVGVANHRQGLFEYGQCVIRIVLRLLYRAVRIEFN
jgi:hypothetical protein